MMTTTCCCQFGSAVSSEWPEGECPECTVHQNGLDSASERDLCRRHKRKRALAAQEARAEE